MCIPPFLEPIISFTRVFIPEYSGQRQKMLYCDPRIKAITTGLRSDKVGEHQGSVVHFCLKIESIEVSITRVGFLR